MFPWLQDHPALVWTIGIASALAFVGTLLALPPLVARIPRDYFLHEHRPAARWAHLPDAVRLAIRIGKSVVGVLFVLAGLAMILLPGQGLLTILVGVLLVEFPGKYRFEKWLVRRTFVRRPLNWMRRRAGKPALRMRRPSCRS